MGEGNAQLLARCEGAEARIAALEAECRRLGEESNYWKYVVD